MTITSQLYPICEWLRTQTKRRVVLARPNEKAVRSSVVQT